MIINRLTLASMALLVAFAGPGAATLLAAPQPRVPAYGQDRDHDRDDWAVPPREFQAIERQGFHDGVEGARRDFGNHRSPNVENRDEFRHPNLPRGQREAYRRGFRRGYEVAASHLWGGGGPAPMPAPPPMYAQPAPAPMPPSGYGQDQGGDAVSQRGFQDGMFGALRDLIENRRPDPDNREEFRNPPVPYQLQGAYRDGFQNGYRVTIQELSGSDYRAMAAGPGGQARQQGYQDGFSGAIKDFGNNRQPNPENRDEFRRPHVPYQLQEAYRDGFRRGYRRATELLQGRPWRHHWDNR